MKIIQETKIMGRNNKLLVNIFQIVLIILIIFILLLGYANNFINLKLLVFSFFIFFVFINIKSLFFLKKYKINKDNAWDIVYLTKFITSMIVMFFMLFLFIVLLFRG